MQQPPSDCHEDQASKRRKVHHDKEEEHNESSDEMHNDDSDYDSDEEEEENERTYHFWKTESSIIKPFPDSSKYIHRKRAPASMCSFIVTSAKDEGGDQQHSNAVVARSNSSLKRRHEIYVSRKSHKQAVLTRACKLLDEFIMSQTTVKISNRDHDNNNNKHKKKKPSSSAISSSEQKKKHKKANEPSNALILHAIGAAMNSCIEIALQIQAEYSNCPMFTMHVNTDTVKLVDDFIPRREYEGELEPLVQVRFNSAVHITFRYHPLSELESANKNKLSETEQKNQKVSSKPILSLR